VIDVPLAYAFSAGLVAAVNPCGFPMLPAYLSWFIGTDRDDTDTAARVLRALGSALAVSLGFLAVFSALGIPINAGVSSIYRWMPWLTIVIGVALTLLGLAMLGGFQLKVALPRLDRAGKDRRFGSMVLFGVSYAIASLSCTLPIFLVVVAGTVERENALSGFLAFVAYSVGMSVVLMVLSLALAFARDGMVRRLRSALQYTDRAAGALLVLVGMYLVYYGIHAARSLSDAQSNPIGIMEDWSTRASSWLEDGGTRLGLAFAALVAVATVWAVLRRRAGARIDA
jgi:cytochrome c biogenesis protein CcdA